MTICRIQLVVLVLGIAPSLTAAAPRAAQTPLAAVVLPGTQDEASGLRELLVEELEKRGIKVNHKPIPARIVAKARGLAAYASAKRLKRVYELRVKTIGEAKVMVSLAERSGRRLRSSFSAKLAAKGRAQVAAVIPQLVEAVVERKEPVPPPPPKVAAAAPAPPTQINATPPETPAAPPEPGQKRGEFLFGFSFAPGLFLNSPSGLVGGSGQILYQRGFYRLGLEIGGMGGGGHIITFSGRGHILFAPSWKIVPVAGLGLGYLLLHGSDGTDGGGGFFATTVGAQFNQVRWAKFVAELEFVLPMFQVAAYDPQLTNGNFELVKRSSWVPAGFLKLSCLF
jgi:hypothetical protein